MNYYKIIPFGSYTYEPYTYAYESILVPGQRVIIDIRGKQTMGLVYKIDDMPPSHIKIKEVEFIIDSSPFLNNNNIKVLEQCVHQFVAPISEIARMFFPPASEDIFKLRLIPLSPLCPIDKPTFLSEFYRKFNSKNEANKKIRELVSSNLLKMEVYEVVQRKKEEKYIKLKASLDDLARLKLSESASNVVNFLLSNEEITEEVLYSNEIIKRGSSVLKTLLKKDLIEFIDISETYETLEVKLSDEQKNAVNSINQKPDKPHLLYGVTGSGKTEVFFELAEEELKKGNSVMILVPEISLTPQLINRLKKRFSDYKSGIYHSSTTPSERVRTWYDAANGEIDILIGTRSSVWIPLRNLKLIIIDEEHDSSYYQLENICYDAIETAYIRHKTEDIKLVLASATPRLIDYNRTMTGDFYIEHLKNRYYTSMPEINVYDIKNEKKVSWLFTSKAVKEIKEVIDRDKKVIIFTPTKGYANYIICTKCGHIFRCKDCDVSMTFHKEANKIKCHYCGKEEKVPERCPECNNYELQTRGFGTERVVNELVKLFPSVPVMRVDRVVITNYDELKKTFDYMHNKGKMIIVGTKMVTKGLDIKDLELVIILDSDRFLHFPDYNAVESAASLLFQVAGRSGRKDEGRVIIQTFNPAEEVYSALKMHDYDKIINNELSMRDSYHYPPFNELGIIMVQNETEEKSREIAETIYNELKNDYNEEEIIEPIEPQIYKLKSKYRLQIMIKTKKLNRESLFKIAAKYGTNAIITINPPTTMI